MSEFMHSQKSAVIRPRLFPLKLITCALTLTCVVTLYLAFIGQGFEDWSRVICPLLSMFALAFGGWLMPRHFTPGFLISTLCLLINWRVAAMMDVWPVMIVSAVSAALMVLILFEAIRADWLSSPQPRTVLAIEWQMTIVRIYFGFDMVGHFTEKLFAGSGSFQHMTAIFERLGVPQPGLFVVLGGLCELAIAIGIGAGLLTRLAGVGATLYFMIANHFGAHFANGFTWSNGPTGGWEYPLLMAVFYLSFALCGAGRFSLDAWLLQRRWMPLSLSNLCTPRQMTMAALASVNK